MDMNMVRNVMETNHSNVMAEAGMAVQKKAMDTMELQGQMLQEMMASMGIGQNLDIRG